MRQIINILFATFTVTPLASADLLWYQAAETATLLGHRVWATGQDFEDKQHGSYDSLKSLGANIRLWKVSERALSVFGRLLQKIRYRFFLNPSTFWNTLFEQSLPDIIVINDPGLCHFVSHPGFCQALHQSKVPYATICQFNTEFGSIASHSYETARTAFAGASASFFVSSRNLNVAERQLATKISNAYVVDNPPNLTEFESLPYMVSETTRLLYVARLECNVKGQDIVLEVLSQQVWQDRDWTLTIAGKGVDEVYLRDLVQFFGLERRVHFIGHSQNIKDLWIDHHLLVLCSHGEGKPLSLVEAMYCGRPALVTDVGGNTELIEDGVTGFVCPFASSAAVSETFERAWSLRETWSEMGQRASLAVRKRQEQAPSVILLKRLLTLH